MNSANTSAINDHAIYLENLTKYYGIHKGIENVSLTVDEGIVHGFLGPNGAGKTTTIRILVGLLQKTRGEAMVLGLPVGTIEAKAEIGYLPSDFELYNYYTVKEYLDFIESIRGRAPRRSQLEKRLYLDVSRKTAELSRGNKQKVAIVQAFMHEPKLLIADEPTTGLDPLMQEVFNTILREFVDRGNTAFISSHILSEVQDNCDIVTVIKNGEIVQTGSVDDLLSDLPRKAILKLAEHTNGDELAEKLGLKVAAHGENRLTVYFDGPVSVFIEKILGNGEIVDFVLPEPDLEEYFLPIYQRS